MRLDIEAGIVWLTDKPSNKESLWEFAKAFGEFADVDFCIDESDEYHACYTGGYRKDLMTIEEIRDSYRYFKKKFKK